MNKNLGLQKVVLTTLITSLAITGISLFDNTLWNHIMIGVGELAYLIVGLLYSGHFISTKKDGREAYFFVLILLLLGVYAVYAAIVKIQQWILSWSVVFKILILILLGVLAVLTFINMINSKSGRR